MHVTCISDVLKGYNLHSKYLKKNQFASKKTNANVKATVHNDNNEHDIWIPFGFFFLLSIYKVHHKIICFHPRLLCMSRICAQWTWGQHPSLNIVCGHTYQWITGRQPVFNSFTVKTLKMTVSLHPPGDRVMVGPRPNKDIWVCNVINQTTSGASPA